jgi:hypothetical protein
MEQEPLPATVDEVFRNWEDFCNDLRMRRLDSLCVQLEDDGLDAYDALGLAARIDFLALLSRANIAGRRQEFFWFFNDDIRSRFARRVAVLTPSERLNFSLARRPRGLRDASIFCRTPGGDPGQAYLAMRYLRRSFRTVRVAVAEASRSAGTLFALGGTELHMGPVAVLGPLDAQVRFDVLLGDGGVGPDRSDDYRSIEEVLAGFDEVWRRVRASERNEEPPMLVNYLVQSGVTAENVGRCHRLRTHIRRLATRLLEPDAARLPRPPEDIARQLVEDFADHGYDLDVAEARDILGPAKVRVNSRWAYVADTLLDHLEFARIGRPDLHVRDMDFDHEPEFPIGRDASLDDLHMALRACNAIVSDESDDDEDDEDDEDVEVDEDDDLQEE